MMSTSWSVHTSGIMICGDTAIPSLRHWMAAATTALVCISVISGCTMDSREPLNPSMGLDSCMSRTRCLHWSGGMPPLDATRSISSSKVRLYGSGRNSCRGGSSRRTVICRSPMMRKILAKSSVCMGSSFSRQEARSSWVLLSIMCRKRSMREGWKNMCSVRHRPTPSAPMRSAASTSVGVSAFASTLMRLYLSAQSMTVRKLSSCPTETVGMAPMYTRPVEPSMVMVSPSLMDPPEREQTVPASGSMYRSWAPVTAGLPMPLMTTAAWEVSPPRRVSTPVAACMPPMSSAEVSSRTRMQASWAAQLSSACSLVNTTLPTAAPEEAARPLARVHSATLGSSGLAKVASIMEWVKKSICLGSMRSRASLSVISLSPTIATAMLTAALAVRLPVRVCSM
mmetsp:Transcript_24658/g.53317  ORF Transcript_24658/g.53317 Transcript_24658/m.53317 type:complete len:397 (+) Transcript_24658:1211-2401(+)